MTLRLGDLGGQAILASGPPSSSTLGSGIFLVGQAYKDTSAGVWYLCSSAGDKTTSVWDALGPGTTKRLAGTGAGDYTLTGSLAAVDATNLHWAVTIPTGWKLRVRAYANFDIAASSNPFLAIADSSTIKVESEISTGIALETLEALALEEEIDGDGASHTIEMWAAYSGTSGKIRNSSAAVSPRMICDLDPRN